MLLKGDFYFYVNDDENECIDKFSELDIVVDVKLVQIQIIRT